MITAKHQILVVGGGTAGITAAARLLRKGSWVNRRARPDQCR